MWTSTASTARAGRRPRLGPRPVRRGVAEACRVVIVEQAPEQAVPCAAAAQPDRQGGSPIRQPAPDSATQHTRKCESVHRKSCRVPFALATALAAWLIHSSPNSATPASSSAAVPGKKGASTSRPIGRRGSGPGRRACRPRRNVRRRPSPAGSRRRAGACRGRFPAQSRFAAWRLGGDVNSQSDAAQVYQQTGFLLMAELHPVGQGGDGHALAARGHVAYRGRR